MNENRDIYGHNYEEDIPNFRNISIGPNGEISATGVIKTNTYVPGRTLTLTVRVKFDEVIDVDKIRALSDAYYVPRHAYVSEINGQFVTFKWEDRQEVRDE